MTPITITEALAELNTISKRLQKKREYVLTYLLRPESLKDPLSKEEGGSVGVLSREMQSFKDLTKRHLAIRQAIQRKNHEVEITIGKLTMSIAEWLTWRKEVAPTVTSFMVGLKQKIDASRAAALRQGGGVVQAGVEAKPTDIVVNLDERELNETLEEMDEVLGTLDGKLSLVNATTTIEVG